MYVQYVATYVLFNMLHCELIELQSNKKYLLYQAVKVTSFGKLNFVFGFTRFKV